MDIDRLKTLAGIKPIMEEDSKWKAGGIPYCFIDGVLHVCLVTPTDPKYGGDKPCVPKGNPDEGDNPQKCAVREVKEETGISHFVKVTPLAVEKVTGLTSSYDLHVYAMETDGISDLHPDYEGIPEWYNIDTALNVCRKTHKVFLEKLVSKVN